VAYGIGKLLHYSLVMTSAQFELPPMMAVFHLRAVEGLPVGRRAVVPSGQSCHSSGPLGPEALPGGSQVKLIAKELG
jgi:hypothetical protein